MIAPNQAGGWGITNLGAILFAKDLDAFKGLSRKAVRVIVYEGKGRLITVREQVGRKGYPVLPMDLLGVYVLLPDSEKR